MHQLKIDSTTAVIMLSLLSSAESPLTTDEIAAQFPVKRHKTVICNVIKGLLLAGKIKTAGKKPTVGPTGKACRAWTYVLRQSKALS
jgi:predicted transcriptional regulator